MMNHRGLAFLAVLAVVAAWAQSPGAKSIFYERRLKNRPVVPTKPRFPAARLACESPVVDLVRKQWRNDPR